MKFIAFIHVPLVVVAVLLSPPVVAGVAAHWSTGLDVTIAPSSGAVSEGAGGAAPAGVLMASGMRPAPKRTTST